MKKRILTGAILTGLVIVFLLLRTISAYFMDVFFLIISIGASVEIATCLLLKEDDKLIKNLFITLSAFLPIVAYSVFAWLGLSNTLGYLIGIEFCVILIFALAIILTWQIKKKYFIKLSYLIPLIYPTFLFFFFYLINHISYYNSTLPDIFALFPIVLAFMVSAFTDTFAMLGGMLFKGPKLCPKISPKKTISGAISGLVFGTIAAVASYFVFNAFAEFNEVFTNSVIEFWMFILWGFVLSAMNQVGDLIESLFKRKTGVKDTGNIFPGHGGLMDRLDGLSLVCFFTFFATYLMFC